MAQVFISYRRDDSADVTGRIFDRLRGHFGSDVLFRDVDAIPLGDDFKAVIQNAVSDCQVLLAVIGPTWTTITDANGDRRLDNPRDMVRLEVATALRRGIPVIPVLVGKAAMPRPDDLPAALRNLVFRNGIEVRRDPDFHNDMDRLISGLTAKLSRVMCSSSTGRGRSDDAAILTLQVEGEPDRQSPTEADLRAVVARLSPGVGRSLLFLDGRGEDYVQAAGGDGRFTAEWRIHIGDRFRHWTAGLPDRSSKGEVSIRTNGFKVVVRSNEVLGGNDVVEIFTAYLRGQSPPAKFTWRDISEARS